MNPAGECCEIFSPGSFREVLEFEESEYSYAGKTSYKGGVIRANSLARANLTAHRGTKVANGYLHRLRIEFGTPAHPIMLFELARGIELVYAIARAAQLLEQPLDKEDTDVPYTPRYGGRVWTGGASTRSFITSLRNRKEKDRQSRVHHPDRS
jgi:F420-non-reducing hydrogenase large subunit